jgi:two-component system response regulator AtoC
MLEQVNGRDWNQVARDEHDAVGMELTGRILIIDDEPHFLRVLARILSGEKFLVTSAAGAGDAIELIKSAQFDLVISDLRMPDYDGLSFLETLRHDGNNVPVIILTAYGEVDTYLAAMNAGANEYLNKPIQSDELLRIVRYCLRSRANRRRKVSSDPS